MTRYDDDDEAIGTWENEGGATCAIPRHPAFVCVRPARGWDVFDQRTGRTVFTVRWRWLARLLVRDSAYDYVSAGEGWL